MSNYYPILLDLKGKTCLVVGGGKIAFRKVSKLLNLNINVDVISPALHSNFNNIASHKCLNWTQGKYPDNYDLSSYSLVFAATDNPKVNLKVNEDANYYSVPANIANKGEAGYFIVPATISQGNLQISISTSGKAPGLSKVIKENLEKEYGDNYDLLISILSSLRNKGDMENYHSLLDLIKNR